MWNNRDKAYAIRQLVVNLGDVQKTAEQTRVPERTLQRWKTELQTEEGLIYWELDSLSFIIRERYISVRNDMITQIQRLLNQISHMPPRYAPDFVNAISRLTDRIEKIENMIETLGSYVIEIRTEELRYQPEDRLSTENGDEQ